MNNAANARKLANPAQPPCNIIVAGLGGQGVLTAADILADAAVRAGFDVKKSAIKGMSQRGGSVACDVRFGAQVHSPMVPAGEADFLLVLEPTQVEPNRHLLRAKGATIDPAAVDASRLPNKKTLNVALLGALSAHLTMTEEEWLEAVNAAFEPKFFEGNRQAFLLGRAGQQAAAAAG
ncbi:MAG: 2-oxoacid:acceptor oxidoreductase family protein [Limisphaerales bacterium]